MAIHRSSQHLHGASDLGDKDPDGCFRYVECFCWLHRLVKLHGPPRYQSWEWRCDCQSFDRHIRYVERAHAVSRALNTVPQKHKVWLATVGSHSGNVATHEYHPNCPEIFMPTSL